MTATAAQAGGIVEKPTLALDWQPGRAGRVYFIHPKEGDLEKAPPCCHRARSPGCGWPLLKAAFDQDRLDPAYADGPVLFVVPELTLEWAPLRQEFEAELRRLPRNRLVICGLGHLTDAECNEIERGFGSDPEAWDPFPRPEGRFANVALVADSGEARYLAAKHIHSHHEERCHWRHRRLRLFTAGRLKTAVIICSELLTEGDPDDPFGQLVALKPDVVVWLQHNPKPRDHRFREKLKELYKTAGDAPLVLAVNKNSANGARTEYGGSGVIAPEECFISNVASHAA